jgi:uncharacterized delta-60 repeat protein
MMFDQCEYARPIESLEPRTLLSNTAGTPDPTFGPDGSGHVITDIGGGASYSVSDMKIDTSGRIIVLGNIFTTPGSTLYSNDIFLFAFTADGSPDPTFGTAGKLVVNLAPIESAQSLIIQGDGKLVLGGYIKSASNEDLLLMRLNSNGSLDNSFGSGGKTIIDSAAGNDRLLDMTTLADGRILASASHSNTAVGRVIRFLPDGNLDSSFGVGGFSAAAPFRFPDSPSGMLVQADGKIIISGSNAVLGGGLVLGRFNPDGTADSSFAFNYAAEPKISGNFTEMASLPDGRFIVSSLGDLVRFMPDGTHDLTFASGGVWLGNRGTPIEPGDAHGLIIDSSGKILRAGYSESPTYFDVTILRQHANGFPDPSFGNESGYDRIDLGGSSERAYAAVLQSPNRLVIAGLTTTDTQRLFLMRVDASNQPNIPPASEAGGPYEVREGALLRFDGSASTDADGAIDHYEWDFNYDGVTFDIDATANRNDFNNPLGKNPLFNAAGIDGPAMRTIALRVVDSQYASTIDTTTLNIINSPPGLLASGPLRITPGQPYTIALAASPDAGQDTITSWQIDWGDGTGLQFLPASSASASHVFATSDNPYHITVSATDEDGTYLANRAALDPTYSDDGWFTQYNIREINTRSALVDPITHKLYFLGDTNPYIYRFNPDGSADTTWGGTGVVPFDSNVFNEYSSAIFLDPDGTLLVNILGEVGHFDYLGRRDLTFGINGRVTSAWGPPFDDGLSIFVPFADGSFMMGGTDSAYPNQLVLAHYSSTGKIDTAFGSGGYVRTQIIPGIANTPLLLTAQSDGKILALIDNSSYSSAYLIRFNADGTVDTTFGPNDSGYVPFQTTSGPRWGVLGMTTQPDGKILAWYNVRSPLPTQDYDFGILRFTADGAPDSSFGTAGHVILDISGENDQIGSVLPAPDGGLLVGGSAFSVNERPVLVKLTDSGQLDATFANGGILMTRPPFGAGPVLVLDDDKLYQLGTARNQTMLVVRLNYGPILARANDAPTIPNVTLNDSVDEGSLYSISGTISDPDVQDSHLLTINWGDGGDVSFVRLAPGVFSWSAQHFYADDNPTGSSSDLNTISITADDGLDSVTTTRSVRVNNIAPVADLGADRTGNEGGTFSFNPTRIDPSPADTFTYAWSALRSDGSQIASGSATSFTFTAPDNDTYTIRLRLTDDDGGQWNDSVAVITANVAPSVNVFADKSGTEGTQISVTPGVSDAGSADVLTYNWSIYRPDNTLGWTYATPTLSFTPPDNGTYRAVLTVTDDDGGVGSDEMLLVIANKAPTLSYVGNSGAFQNGSYQLSLSATDPGTDTISSWTINWGDGSATQTVVGSQGQVTHVYTTLGSGIQLSGQATDEDGTYFIPIKIISVVPAPTLMADGTLLINGTPRSDSLSLSFIAPSNSLQVNLSGAILEYPIASVLRFEASMLAGDDNITFPTSAIPGGIVRGQDGNDIMTINAPLSWPIQFLGGDTGAFLDVLYVNAGTYTFDSDPRAGTARLGVTVNNASVTFNASAHLDGLVLNNGAHVTVSPNIGLLKVTLLSIVNSALDMTNNDLIVQASAVNAASVASSIASLLRDGYNRHWQNTGFTSSFAAVDSTRAFGFMRNLGPKFTSFDGEAVDVNSTIVAYTIIGDLNLDRSVTIADFIDLSSNFNKTATSWISGDVNFDQKTTIADFIDLAGNFGLTLAPPAPPAPAPRAAADLQLQNEDSASALADPPRGKRPSTDALPQRNHPRPGNRRHPHHPAPRFARSAN